MVPTSSEYLRPDNFNSDLFDEEGHLIEGPLEVNDSRINPTFNGWDTNIPPTPTKQSDENEIPFADNPH